MPDGILSDLAALVGFDTANPPRRITTETGVMPRLAARLTSLGFHCAMTDLGEGCINLLARRGQSRTLFNCHLDTVPACDGWTGDPLVLRVDGDRATGLGACDVKGAAACLLAAADATNAPAALLFTTDEEAGTSRCVRTFVETARDRFDRVVVSEPTGCRAVTAHRGLVSAEVCFAGRSGHASGAGAGATNANHAAATWCHAALARSAALAASGEDVRLNLGVIEGGIKANMAAASCRVIFGMRPWATMETDAALRAIIDPLPEGAVLTERFRAPGLGACGWEAWLEAWDIERGEAVDFWTEAALFAASGLPAVVLGPGSIEQAHAADEFVGLGELERGAALYRRMMEAAAS
ncbi:MAG: acetylornithine deacetylase [Phycisphaerales bacterium]|nr:acetylornithine deacetylase [Phycisphaerales bacterium]